MSELESILKRKIFANEDGEANWWFENRLLVEREIRGYKVKKYNLGDLSMRYVKAELTSKSGRERMIIVVFCRHGDRIRVITAWDLLEGA